jgi:hypothetical protein
MGNTLVARHGHFRVNVRCAFDAKFHLTFRMPGRSKLGKQNHPISAALVQRCDAVARERCEMLRNEKDFIRVRILNFGSRREPAHIHVPLIRCVGAGDESRLVRNWNSVGQITFGRARCGRRGSFRRHVLLCCLGRGRWLIWIVGLRCRLVFGRSGITRYVVTHRRLIISAGYESKAGD